MFQIIFFMNKLVDSSLIAHFFHDHFEFIVEIFHLFMKFFNFISKSFIDRILFVECEVFSLELCDGVLFEFG